MLPPKGFASSRNCKSNKMGHWRDLRQTATILPTPSSASRNVNHTLSNSSAPTASPGQTLDWTTPERLERIRSILLGLTLFVALLVWTAFSIGLVPRGVHLVTKLRVVGAMTWLYALVQIVDMKVWHSRFAQRRRATSRIGETLEGWLLGQMIAWFGIVYYGLTDDPRWFAGGLLILLLSFAAFPIRASRPPTPDA
jgi:hypothetical protein